MATVVPFALLAASARADSFPVTDGTTNKSQIATLDDCHGNNSALTYNAANKAFVCAQTFTTFTTTTTGGGTTTTTLLLCAGGASEFDPCGDGTCTNGTCLTHAGVGGLLCVDVGNAGGNLDFISCSADSDCALAPYPLCLPDIPACGPACGTVTTTTLFPPDNVTVYCDHDGDSTSCSGEGDDAPCAHYGDGSVCKADHTGPVFTCTRPICIVGSTIACRATDVADFVCSEDPGRPACTVSANCTTPPCASAVDNGGPLGYQDQCHTATGGTVYTCATGTGFTSTTTVSTTTTSTTGV